MKTNSQLAKNSIKLAFIIASIFIPQSCNQKSNTNSDKTISQNIANDEFIKAPNFELTSTLGKAVRLSDYLGKVVVIHIATTWCPYCNAEAPYLQKLSDNYKSKGVEVIIIDVKEPKTLVSEKLVDNFNLTFPVLLDSDGAVAASFAPKDILPELSRDEIMLASNIVVDRNGNIQFMSLLDTKNFDSKLIHVEDIINEIL